MNNSSKRMPTNELMQGQLSTGRNFKKLCRFASQAMIATIIFLSILGSTTAESLQLGGMSYARISAQPLVRPVSRGATFFRKTGGIAFEAIAVGRDNQFVEYIRYDSNRPDGQRLLVTLSSDSDRTNTVVAPIYDWQIVPIAQFADSDNGSAMTLFGELMSPKLTEEVQSAKGRVINYHPALDNTLVGLRLMQADIVLFQENGTDLFKRSDGSYILGNGEINHNPQSNKEKFVILSDWIKNNGTQYSSYVVGDLDQRVTFWVEGDQLKLDGNPYWWMWREFDQRAIDSSVLQAVNTIMILEGKNEASLTAEARQVYTRALEIADAYISAGNTFSELEARLESYANGQAPVKSLPEFSNRVSSVMMQLDGVNPLVYQTLKTVMHYRALFVHFKQRDSTAYREFLASLNNVEVLPKVETPTVQYGSVH